MDLGGVLIPVNGQPAIGKEAELFTGLEVVDDEIAEIPGLHLPDSTVVMPDLEAHQVTQRPGILVKFHIGYCYYLSTVIKNVSKDPFLKKFFSGSDSVRI